MNQHIDVKNWIFQLVFYAVIKLRDLLNFNPNLISAIFNSERRIVAHTVKNVWVKIFTTQVSFQLIILRFNVIMT